jgi:hypothetical protein
MKSAEDFGAVSNLMWALEGVCDSHLMVIPEGIVLEFVGGYLAWK